MATAYAGSQASLTTNEIARQKSVHPSAVVRWMRRGAVLANGTRVFLRYERLPGGYRVKPEWLEEFLEALAANRSGAHRSLIQRGRSTSCVGTIRRAQRGAVQAGF